MIGFRGGPGRGVLFDMDGVLVFSSSAWFGVYNDTLDHFGHPRIPEDEFLTIFGNGTAADREKYMPERSIAEIDEAYRRFFRQHLSQIDVNPSAESTLRRLAASGAKIGLATNTNHGLAEAILGQFGLTDLLDALAGADEAGAGKPDPAVVRLAASKLGLPLDRCVFVGDSIYDEEAARRAPVDFIGFRFGSGPRRIEELSEISG
ncbi:MAG: HAD family hydrolase [Thermoanaerobaculia bacterium]